jgi:signal transduction histidine kinase
MQNQELSIDELNQQIRCVSHEIRNHLSICDMYSQIIKRNLEKEGISNSSIENALDCIQKSVQIIGANLLDLKSLNQNNPQILDFSKSITRATNLAKAYVVDKNIEFEIFIKNSANIFIDENKFLACLVNILKNGIESIEHNGKIEILAEIKDNIGIIKLSNNGKPIPKEKQEQIFKQGYTTKKTGCGIGLALCKNFLETSGATLNLTQSTKTKTTFEIKIPTSI